MRLCGRYSFVGGFAERGMVLFLSGREIGRALPRKIL